MELNKKQTAVNGSRYEEEEKEAEAPALRRIRRLKVCLLVIGVSVGLMSAAGMMMAWPNVFAVHISETNSTIYDTEIHLDSVQMDMIASMVFAGSMPGHLLAGWLVGTIGRRKSMIAASIPTILGTLLVALSYNAYMLIFGRFLEGVSFGMMLVSSRTYIVEIAGLNFRGAASVIVNVMTQLGSLIVLSLGIVFSWYYVAFVSCCTMLTYCCLIIPFVPESPAYLVVNNRETEALAVLLKLRGPCADIHKELKDIRDMNDPCGSKREGFRGLLHFAYLQKLLTLFCLFFIANFSGVQALKMNTVRMLQSSDLKFNRSVSAIVVAVALLIGNSIMMMLLDKIGRRCCLISSFCLVALAYYCLGSYFYIMEYSHLNQELDIKNLPPMKSNATVAYDNNPSTGTETFDWSWVPLVCLLLVGLGQSMGAGPIPYIFSSEYFPANVRSQGMSICSTMSGLQSFAVLQLFSPLQDSLTSGGLYWVYAAAATVGIPYTIFFIEETRGKIVG